VNGRALGRRAFPYLLVSAFGFLLAYVLLFLFAFPAEVLPDDGKVPNVVGISFDDASAALEKAGFHAVQGETRYHRTVAQGIVLQQDPPAGSTQKRGIDVNLAVSGGQKAAVVPDVARRHGLTPQQLFGWRRQARQPASGCTTPVATPRPRPSDAWHTSTSHLVSKLSFPTHRLESSHEDRTCGRLRSLRSREQVHPLPGESRCRW